MNKFNTTILVLILVVVIAGIGVVLVFNQKEDNSQPASNESKDSQVLPSENEANNEPEHMVDLSSDIDTSDWQTYRNEELGFSFEYPEDWGIDLKESTSSGLITLKEDTSEIQNITVRIKDDQSDELFDNGTYASLGTSIAFGDYSCGFDVRGYFLLSDGLQVIIFPHQPEFFPMTEEVCYGLFNEFDEKRKLSTRAGSEVIFSEDEVPDQYFNNYKIFKKIVDSFQNL